MARGGFRPGAGRPKGSREVKLAVPAKLRPAAAPKAPRTRGADQAISAAKITPLEYMLRVMNDETVDEARRDRMAVAAAPFMHGRAGETGKREREAEMAKNGATGKFAPPSAPRLVVDNR